MIEIRCDRCGHVHRVDEQLIGRKAVCSSCRTVFRVSEDISPWLKVLAHAERAWRLPEEELEPAAVTASRPHEHLRRN